MSFINRFYNINFDLSLCHKDIFITQRIKLPLFEDDDLIAFLLRLVCFFHGYKNTAVFSKIEPKNLIETKELDIFTPFAYIGTPSEKIISAIKSEKVAKEFSFYFLNHSQIHEFCKLLKGSKTNWVKDLTFWFVSEIQEADVNIEGFLSNKLFINSTDENELSLISGEQQLAFEFSRVDIWDEFQKTLQYATK